MKKHRNISIVSVTHAQFGSLQAFAPPDAEVVSQIADKLASLNNRDALPASDMKQDIVAALKAAGITIIPDDEDTSSKQE